MSVKPLVKGDTVVMHTCGEANHNNGKIWTCKGDEFTSSSGRQVVFLEGFSGYFMCDYLQVVNVDSNIKNIIHERLNYLEKEQCTNESRDVERMIRYDEVLLMLHQINCEKSDNMDGNLAMADSITYETEEQNGFWMSVVMYMDLHKCDKDTAIKAVEKMYEGDFS